MAPIKRKRKDDDLTEKQRDLINLPRDILFEIYQRLDDKVNNKFELQRIRSVCSSWRSSLSPLTSITPLQFPLKLPPPPFLDSIDGEPSTYSCLSQSDLYLFPSPFSERGHQVERGWIVKVEQRVESRKWCLENSFLMMPALFEDPNLSRGSFDIFDCNVMEITRAYSLEYGTSNGENSNKAKAVIGWNSDRSKDKYDDFTVLVLFGTALLGLWRPEEVGWSIIRDAFSKIMFFYDQHILDNKSRGDFSDIIAFKGKFYAATMGGRLIMIYPITYEVTGLIKDALQLKMEYGCPSSYLVESNGRLYLVYKEAL